MKGRALQIYQAGMEALEDTTGYRGIEACQVSGVNQALLKAMTAMLAEATKAKSGPKVKEGPTLPVSPTVFYETIRDQVGDIVLCEPYNKFWFSRLGKEMHNTAGFEAADLDRLVSWIRNGGLSWWNMGKPNFGHLIKHLGNWIISARAASGATQATAIMDRAFD